MSDPEGVPTWAARLSARIKQQKVTVTGLARKVKRPRSTIYRWMGGEMPDAISMYEVADALKCSVRYLLGTSDDATLPVFPTPQQARIIALTVTLTPQEQDMVAESIEEFVAVRKKNHRATP